MIHLDLVAQARRLLDAAGRIAGKRRVKDRPVAVAVRLPRGNGKVHFDSQPVWMETQARVTNCKYAPAGWKPWRWRSTHISRTSIVSFTYYAHARTYHGIFITHGGRAEGDTFPVYYNALSPQRNILSPPWRESRRAKPEVAILGVTTLAIFVLAASSG